MTPKLQKVTKRLWSDESPDSDFTVRQKLLLQQPLLNTLAYRWTNRAIQQRKSVENAPTDVLDTVLEYEPGWGPYRVTALQHRNELEQFIQFLRAKEPRVALEIGMFQGGTLYVWARTFNSIQHITCVDKPVWNEMVHERRRDLYPTFSDDTHIDINFGDSHAVSTYEKVVESVGENVDFLFIDGDHSYDGVSQDFETYRKLVDDNGIIAFHDIKRHAKDQQEKAAQLRDNETLQERHVSVGLQRWNGVSTFWKEIQDEFTTREFLTHPKQMGAGIGVVEL